MACKCAEDFILNCHRCGIDKKEGGGIIITPKKGFKNSFWALCPKCYEEEGSIWWAHKDFTYTVNRSES